MSKRSKVDETVKEFYKTEGKKFFENIKEYVPTREVYEEYESYCKANNLEPVTIYKLTMDIKKLVPKLNSKKKTIGIYYIED